MNASSAERTTLALVQSASSANGAAPSPALDEQTFVRLEKTARRAANDSMKARQAPTDGIGEDQFDSLAMHLLAIGIRAFERFDPALTVSDRDGYSFAYREMRGYRKGQFTEGPYIDWLRTNIRDDRFEPKASTSLTELGNLPELLHEEAPTLESVAEHYAVGLSERDAWTLRHVAAAIAGGFTLVQVVEGLLSDLADALQPQLGENAPKLTSDLSSFGQLFSDWFQEAAA